MKIVIHGYYGAGNIGDEAILENIIDSVFKEFTNAQFTVLSRGLCSVYRGDKNVEVIDINSFSLVEEKIKMADAVIVGGGGIFQDYSGFQLENNKFGTQAKGMNYYGQIVNLASEYGKKIYFYSIGIGPLFSSEAKDYACLILSKGIRISVRDTESYTFVTENLPDSEVILSADPALNLEGISKNKAQQLLRNENIPLNKKLVGICLRPWRFKNNEQEELLNRLAEATALLSKEEDVHFVLLPFCQYKGDKRIIAKLAKKLPEDTYTVLEKNYCPKALKGILGEFSLMIGMRLHSLILSASMGVPVIGISYDPKVSLFVNMLGSKSFSFPYQLVQTEKLLNLSIKLLNMSDSDREQFKEVIFHLKEKEKLNTEFLFSKKETLEEKPKRKLRIAHFGKYAEGDTDIVRSMLLSLSNMGHDVQEWNTGFHPEWIYNPHKRRGGYGPVYIRLRRIREELMDFKPDLIICNAGGHTFTKSDMSWLKSKGIPILGITLSDPDVMDSIAEYAEHFTWHTTNALTAFEEYKKRGFTNIYYMPFGIDYRFFKNRPPIPEYDADVAIIGHGRKDRYLTAEALCKNFNTRLYGRNWTKFSAQSMGPVRGDDWFKAAYSAKILVNFPRTMKGYTNIKVGILEATATGKLVFTEYFDEMKQLFEYDHEIIGYSSKEDLMEKIRYYLQHPEEAEVIGQNAKQRCLRDHTWEQRFNRLFRELGLN